MLPDRPLIDRCWVVTAAKLAGLLRPGRLLYIFFGTRQLSCRGLCEIHGRYPGAIHGTIQAPDAQHQLCVWHGIGSMQLRAQCRHSIHSDGTLAAPARLAALVPSLGAGR